MRVYSKSGFQSPNVSLWSALPETDPVVKLLLHIFRRIIVNNSKHREVPPEKLRWQCDPSSLGFKTTDELKSTECIIGQERALKAIKLGLEVKSPGYNI